MKKTLICMLAFSFAMGMTAQTKVEGEVTLGAGYGETAPYLGDVNLKINSGKFTIMPFFNIKGITPYNSKELSDINLTYSDSGNKYSQEQELQSKGYHMEYGAGIQYLHNDHNIFKASFEGGYLNKSVIGYHTENLLNPNGGLMYGVKSFLNYPTLNSLEMKVQASYLHKTQREGEQLMLKYTYELEKEDEDKCQELTETEGFNDYSLSHITGDIDIHSHEVLFDWKRPLAQHHILNMGVRYNHRYIISDDAQYLDGREWYDEVFRHRMQTAAVFAGYTLKANALDADVRVEYDYTRMQ
ncbi:MAG: outer membrane beta-barrel protein, partial [Bacteroidaceae bacterium]|nr:outer membrane beta-barrel protein [Bacteroidaceae bacterium]